jgi:uncharacterized membrane protein
MSVLGQGEEGLTAAAGPGRARRVVLAARRLALATLAGLVLAGMIHILTVLLIPPLSERDAASAYAMLGASGKAELVQTQESRLPAMQDADPAVVTAVCGYDLAAGPMRVMARAGALPLSLALHRRGGGVIYAITDRAAVRGVVEFVVMTEARLDERVARDEEEQTVRELRIVSDTQQGVLVARALAKLPSDRSDAEALATGVACGPAD